METLNVKMVVLMPHTTVKIGGSIFKLLFILFFSSVMIQEVSSQNYIEYYKYHNEAVHLYYLDSIQKADSLLTIGFTKAMPSGKDVYFSAVMNAILLNKQKAEKMLKLSSAMDGFPHYWVREDSSIFRRIFNAEEYNNLLDTITILDKISKDAILSRLFNTSSYSFLDSLIHLDQKYRSEYDQTLGLKEEEKLLLMYMNDKIVQDLLMDYVEEFGWPYYSELLTTILLHFSKENYIKYKEVLLKEVKLGHLDPFWYAMMFDRLEKIYFNNLCTYGIWTKGGCDENLIRANRISIGLSPYYEGPYRTFRKVKPR